jgi:rod shape-determining protein MreC
MAPPTNRRPGFSRKAQYGIFATYVLAIAGAVFAALLLIISIADPSGFAALRVAGAEVTAPIARSFDAARRTVIGMNNNMSAYLDAASKNAAMKRELQAHRNAIIEAKAIKLENQRLKKLLNLVETDPEYVAMGRLISTSATSARRLATVSVGASSGLQKGQPVRAPEGLIGRIIEVGPTTARVLLITDADNVVPVMRLSDGLPAFASGLSNGQVAIRPISLGINPFKIGDIIATSGNGGLYRPNIPYAVVVKKTPDGATAQPLADPSAASNVVILPIYQAAATAADVAATKADASPGGNAP